jgi:hypothetical protein
VQSEFKYIPYKNLIIQVDIFLRRAFFNAGGKLHCLMNADLMKLTVCEEVKQRIQQFKRVSDKECMLYSFILRHETYIFL